MPMPEIYEEESPFALEATKDHFDTIAQGANLLMVAHGAGLVGCVTLLKEHVFMYGGVGLYILIFGVGLTAAVYGYSLLTFARMNAISVVAGSRFIRSGWETFSYWSGIAALTFSMMNLYAAIWGIIVTAFGIPPAT